MVKSYQGQQLYPKLPWAGASGGRLFPQATARTTFADLSLLASIANNWRFNHSKYWHHTRLQDGNHLPNDSNNVTYNMNSPIPTIKSLCSQNVNPGTNMLHSPAHLSLGVLSVRYGLVASVWKRGWKISSLLYIESDRDGSITKTTHELFLSFVFNNSTMQLT